MNFQNYIEHVKNRLLRSYDLEENKVLGGREMNLFGAYHLRTERYIATKKAVVYGMENHEYICLFHLTALTEDGLTDYINWIKQNIDDLVNPHREHMSTMVSLVLVCDVQPSEEVLRKVRRVKFHKGYSFGFKGWVDLKLLVYSLEDQSLITNRKGEEGSEAFQIS